MQKLPLIATIEHTALKNCSAFTMKGTVMKTKEFINLKWSLFENNPIIKYPFPSPIIADPTFITPDESKDNKWHLFAHSLLGIHHYISMDGINYTRLNKQTLRRAMRPFLLYANGMYYLYYEKTKPFILWYSWLPHQWYSYIAMRSSKDCYTWSDEKIILKPSLPWHHNNLGYSISNPCVVKTKNTYYLYYSAALAYIMDCGFNEPLYIGLAKAQSPEGPFECCSEPILAPSQYNRWCNLGCGSFKVLPFDDGFIGLQNGIYWDYTINHSGSAILVYSSKDGITFNALWKDPLVKPDNIDGSFMKSHVYAFDAKPVDKERWFLYFNARSDWHWSKGREHIGLLIGKKSKH